MSLLTRRRKDPPEWDGFAADPNAWARVLAEQAQRRAYADGLLDGMEITLRLLLGDADVVQGVPPCPGVLPWHVHRWARAALRRIKEAKR